MCKGIKYQTMIHFKSLLDREQSKRSLRETDCQRQRRRSWLNKVTEHDSCGVKRAEGHRHPSLKVYEAYEGLLAKRQQYEEKSRYDSF